VTSTAANAGDSARSLHQPASGRRFRGFFGIGADRKNLHGAEFASALPWAGFGRGEGP
jgi:hypothetical protein